MYSGKHSLLANSLVNRGGQRKTKFLRRGKGKER